MVGFSDCLLKGNLNKQTNTREETKWRLVGKQAPIRRVWAGGAIAWLIFSFGPKD